MRVDWTHAAFLLAVLVIAVLWWRLYGAEFIYHRLRFCVRCRREAINCSCPIQITFTPWDSLDDDEKDDAL